jgi:hypothetical protein
MGVRTGNPRGRPKGAKNRRTKEVEAATAEAAAQIEAALGEAFEGDAHALLMAVYKNTALDLPLRLDAAKAAIRFEKPALQATKGELEVKAQVEAVEWRVIDPSATGA